MPNYTQAPDDRPGDLQPNAVPLGALLVAPAPPSGMRFPILPRLARVGRDLTGEAFRRSFVWRNPADRQ